MPTSESSLCSEKFNSFIAGTRSTSICLARVTSPSGEVLPKKWWLEHWILSQENPVSNLLAAVSRIGQFFLLHVSIHSTVQMSTLNRSAQGV